MKQLFLFMLIGILAVSCSQKNWEQTQDAVIVYPQQTGDQEVKAIKITPVHDEIIRVSASASKTFSTSESLITVPQEETVSFQVEEDGDNLIIAVHGQLRL